MSGFLLVLLTLAALLFVLLGRILVGVLTAEAVASLSQVSRLLVRRAAQQLPPEHQDRWAEEWQAEVEAYGDRRLAALRCALDIRLRGARKLRPSWPRLPSLTGPARLQSGTAVRPKTRSCLTAGRNSAGLSWAIFFMRAAAPQFAA